MRGFTLTELIVVVAVIALAATLGTRYYFTNVEMYRFQNVLSEFKSSVNLARARSMSGRVSMGGVVGNTPVAISINQISIDANNNITLTPAPNQNLTGVSNGSYVTLNGFCPSSPTILPFPYYINGGMYRVTGKSDSSLNLVFMDMSPQSGDAAVATTNVSPTAAAFLKYCVQITPMDSIPGGHYAKAYESGPLMDFQYNQNMVNLTFDTDPSSNPAQPWIIVFDKGLTSRETTYAVSLTSLQKSGATPVVVKINPAGAVR